LDPTDQSIMWYSKTQNTVESSTFDSEFVAMRICVELIESLQYDLRMHGVPIEGLTDIFCDNKSAFMNATLPTPTLKTLYHWTARDFYS